MQALWAAVDLLLLSLIWKEMLTCHFCLLFISGTPLLPCSQQDAEKQKSLHGPDPPQPKVLVL